jgi:hypothetical protein
MATKIGYINQQAESQINWAEVGANFTGVLNEEARVREEKKAEIDRATREQMKVLQNTPMGDSKNVRQWGLNFSDDAQKQLLMANALLKSGDLKPKDYTIMRQNLADGTDQAFTLIQEYQNEYADKMARLKSNDPNASSQDLEVYLMQTVEGFGNFNKSQLVINPTTGEVLVGFKNDKGELESDSNKLVGINNLRNRITSKYDRYNMEAAVLDGQKMFGEFEMVTRELGKKGKQGTIIKYSNPALRTKEGIDKLVKEGAITQEYADGLSKFPELLNAWVGGQLSNEYNITSLLTNNLPGIGGQKFDFTLNPKEQDYNTILLKQVDGNVVPDFSGYIGEAQKKIAEEGLKDVFTGALDQKIDVTQVGGEYVPPPERRAPTESEIARGIAKKKEVTVVSNVAKLFYGTNEEVEEATKFIRSTNPNIVRIDRDGSGVEVFYKDGSSEELPFGAQSQQQWVTGSTNFFLSDNEKIADVAATVKRSGADFTKGLNTTSKGTSVGMIETTEGVDDTYKRVLQEKGFKPSIFIADDEDSTLNKIQNLLSTIPLAAGFTATTGGYGTTDEIVISDKDGIVASFNLDDLTPETATDYMNNLIDIIVSNTDDKGKASMIEGKQVKTTKPAAESKKTKEETTSKPTANAKPAP